MKLRFRHNSLRLRLNRREVAELARGIQLEEQVNFPGSATLVYRLSAESISAPVADLAPFTINVALPSDAVSSWNETETVGLYYALPAGEDTLDIAVEKDLECIDGPAEERDPEAFPRKESC